MIRPSPTVPVAEPNSRIDYIFYRPASAFRLKEARVIPEVDGLRSPARLRRVASRGLRIWIKPTAGRETRQQIHLPENT